MCFGYTAAGELKLVVRELLALKGDPFVSGGLCMSAAVWIFVCILLTLTSTLAQDKHECFFLCTVRGFSFPQNLQIRQKLKRNDLTTINV